jgi:penicillin-binding protein 1A
LSLVRTLSSLVVIGGLAAGVAGLAVGLAVIDENARDLPDHAGLATYVPRTGSRILAEDGSLISRKVEQRRTFVPISKVPPLVLRAFLSAEDRNYYQHGGVDPVAVARAALSRFSGGGSGASTITQQVAKNLLVGNERSMSRKIREALLAMRMDRDLGKDRVLEIYLNEIYLGLGAYGIAEAAQTYFGKPLDQLAPVEAALLAGMPKAPSAFNPRRNPVRATERRNYVLRRMAEDGVIPAAAAESAEATAIALAPRGGRDGDGNPGSWFEDVAWRTANDSAGADRIGRQDVVVRTTLRPAYQAAAEAALKAGIVRADRALGYRGPIGRVRLPLGRAGAAIDLPAGAEDYVAGVVESFSGGEAVVALDGDRRVRLGAEGTRWAGAGPTGLFRPGDAILLDLSGTKPALAQAPEVDGALVAVDPRTGDVLALVGGFSYERSSFDRATQARRQAGSSYKPILYSAALRLGFDATSPLLDAPIALEQGPGQVDWRPADAKGAGHGGLITVRRALELSRNMATVRLLWDLGLDEMQDMARQLGVAPERALTYVSALGAVEVSPLQMALAYAAFADGGLARKPRYVTEVRSASGEVLASVPPDPGRPVLDTVASAQMCSILRGVVERGTARRAFQGFASPFSGKTGTTNSARDAWFVGFSPEISVAVWIGRDDNKALADDAGGGKVAAPVVREFLEGAGVRTSACPVPPEAQTVSVDPESGAASSGRNAVAEIVREIPELASTKARKPARPPPVAARPAPRRQAEPPPDPFPQETYVNADPE